MLREVASYLYRQSKYVMGRIQGWTLGIVEDVEDPMGLGRVRLRFPWHKDGEMSPWAWPATAHLWDRGGSTFHIPQRGEVAVVIFLEGDMTKPAYLGTLWTPGGTGPLGQIPPHKALIKGGAAQTPDSYDHMKAPDLSSKPSPEFPDGAWISNNPRDRVDEWKHYGGLRLIWENFKRRLRLWTHPSTPFHLLVEHYDEGSPSPPRPIPYHALKLSTPSGTQIIIEEDLTTEDDNLKRWEVKVLHHAGHLIALIEHITEAGVVKSEVLVQDKAGDKVLIDALSQKVQITANAEVHVSAPHVLVDSPSVELGGAGGSPVARLGDQVIVYGVMPGPGTATGQIISGSPKVTSG